MLNSAIKHNLSKIEYNLYARQIIIQEIDLQGQKRLKQAKILCVGAGGLNSPTLLYLAACGIGTIGIIDNDNIEISNLQRQIIYNSNCIKKNKIKSAFNTLKSLNPYITINGHNNYLTKHNITNILLQYDIIIDGTDNFEVRYIISQCCYHLHKVHIYGAIEQFTGQVSVFNYQNGPQYYNLYRNISTIRSNSCNTSGLVNTLAGFIGILQATEAIKIILGIGVIISNYLIVFNILQSSLNKIKIKPNSIEENITIKSSEKNQELYISMKKIKNKNHDSYRFIDVRTSLEFRLKYIEKAINIPLNIIKQEVSIERLQKMAPYKLIIYCDNENRSYIASQILQRYDISHYILRGGINAIRKERDSNPR